MSMLSFARKEPAAPQIPVEHTEVTEEVANFINSSKRQRERLAYLEDECTNLRHELRLANDRHRLAAEDLANLKEEFFRLMRHDTTMLAGLGQIKALIVKLEEDSRDQEYAPAGSGTTQSRLPDNQADEALAGLAKALAPEPAANG